MTILYILFGKWQIAIWMLENLYSFSKRLEMAPGVWKYVFWSSYTTITCLDTYCLENVVDWLKLEIMHTPTILCIYDTGDL